MEARSESWCARTPFGLAVLRHRQAGQLLRDRRLRQGSHAWPDIIGISGRFAEFWKASLISIEGAEHRNLRRIAQAALSNDFVLSLEPAFRGIAADLADSLRDADAFEFVSSFSEPFAGRAITTLLALPDRDAHQVARDASTLGLAMGLDARSHEAAVNAACSRLSDLAAHLIDRARLGQDKIGYVARLVGEADAAGFTDGQALIDLVVISIFGGVDTTRAQLAFAAYLFAQHADQWRWLRQNPEMVPQAIEEVIRRYPTTTWATREALETFEHDGVEIRKGATIHVFVHATATDPATGADESFNIREPQKTHFGFGAGAHHCLGQFVARTDMAAALLELLERWQGITLVGQPKFLPDSGNTSPSRLVVRPIWG